MNALGYNKNHYLFLNLTSVFFWICLCSQRTAFPVPLIFNISFFSMITIISFEDAVSGRIKNAHTLLVLTTGIFYAASSGFDIAAKRALEAASVLIVLSIISRATKNGIGGGDIKLLAAAAPMLGMRKTIAAFCIGTFAAAIIGVIIIIKNKKPSVSHSIPFAPFLELGMSLAVFV